MSKQYACTFIQQHSTQHTYLEAHHGPVGTALAPTAAIALVPASMHREALGRRQRLQLPLVLQPPPTVPATCACVCWLATSNAAMHHPNPCTRRPTCPRRAPRGRRSLGPAGRTPPAPRPAPRRRRGRRSRRGAAAPASAAATPTASRTSSGPPAHAAPPAPPVYVVYVNADGEMSGSSVNSPSLSRA